MQLGRSASVCLVNTNADIAVQYTIITTMGGGTFFHLQI